MDREMARALARQALWTQGIVAEWYLRDDQKPLYDLLCKTDRPFIECARRYGKTTTILVWVIERLLQNPGWIATWCEPDKNQAREIVDPEIHKLFKLAPPEMRPVWSTTDSYFWFPSTGAKADASKLKLRGVNHDRGDSARGPFSNIIVCDEYGFWRTPSYTVKEALMPQLQTTNGPLIKASTPPEDLAHPYYEEKELADRTGRFIQKVIYDNKSLSSAKIDKIIEDCGGSESPAFQREYLCNPVADPRKLVIPEYAESLCMIEDNWPAPEFFAAYVGGDSGADDNTFILFGYHDFVNEITVIEDEYVTRGTPTEEIIQAAKAKEAELWKGLRPKRRVYDADKQLLLDICSTHKYPVVLPEKADRIAAINALRTRVKAGKFKIKRRCKRLHKQLASGMWSNDKHTDFMRSEEDNDLGHLDGIAAAVYFNRSVDVTFNPYPQDVGLSTATHFIYPKSKSLGTKGALTEAFRPFKRGGFGQNK